MWYWLSSNKSIIFSVLIVNWRLALVKQTTVSDERSKVAEVLGLANAVDLILLMKERKEIKTSDIRLVPGGYYRLKDVLDKLIASGIVEKKLIEKPYMTFFFTLSKKGEEVAKKLVEIDAIIAPDDAEKGVHVLGAISRMR